MRRWGRDAPPFSEATRVYARGAFCRSLARLRATETGRTVCEVGHREATTRTSDLNAPRMTTGDVSSGMTRERADAQLEPAALTLTDGASFETRRRPVRIGRCPVAAPARVLRAETLRTKNENPRRRPREIGRKPRLPWAPAVRPRARGGASTPQCRPRMRTRGWRSRCPPSHSATS